MARTDGTSDVSNGLSVWASASITNTKVPPSLTVVVVVPGPHAATTNKLTNASATARICLDACMRVLPLRSTRCLLPGLVPGRECAGSKSYSCGGSPPAGCSETNDRSASTVREDILMRSGVQGLLAYCSRAALHLVTQLWLRSTPIVRKRPYGRMAAS